VRELRECRLSQPALATGRGYVVPIDRLVLVHGSVRNGDFAWSGQHELAAHFELVILNRPGFPPNPPEERIDFEDHARWVAERLQPEDHLCGHSYGAVIALFAAVLARGLRSLIVIEPPAFGLADDPEVAAFAERQKAFWSDGPSETRAFLSGFYALSGRDVELPEPLPPDLEQGAQALTVQRGPWEAKPPLAKLAAEPYPKLVVSGGWSPVFEKVCDVLEKRLAAERTVIRGAGHNVQRAPGFNDALLSFLR
jgi:pimeloyl-ACP methyl ester carboxylesterase